MASGSRSIYKGSDEIFDHNCDVCLTQGITSEGISYCTVCIEYLCQRCEHSHKGSKASKDHRLLTGSAVPSGSTKRKQVPPIMLCDTHKTSIIDFICTDHDEAICDTCKMANHRKCRTVDLSRKVKQTDVHGTFEVVTKELADLSDRFNNLQKTRETDKASMKRHIQTCLKDLKNIRKNINDKLDKVEKTMTTEIREIENKISKEIDDHDAMLKKVLFQIEDLNKSLNECQKTRDNDVIFVGMKKASPRKTEFEKIIASIEEDIYPIDIRMEPNDILTDLMNQLQNIGTLVTGKQNRHSTSAPTSVPNKAGLDKQVSDRRSFPNSLLNIEITGKMEEIDVRSNAVYGCEFMTDGHLVVTCCHDGLKLFDKDCRYKSASDIKSWGVTVMDDTDIIVTQSTLKQLKRVRVLPDMKVVKTVKMDRWCFGVDVCGDELYVTCHDLTGNGEVRVLTMDGNVLRRLGVDNGKYMFTAPNFVKVGKDGGKVFVSDRRTRTITCLNTQGRTLYEYSNRDLKHPCGMYVDGDDNLMVCGADSNNVHFVRPDGEQEKILLSSNTWLMRPQDMSYGPRDRCLAVVTERPPKLMTFSARI